MVEWLDNVRQLRRDAEAAAAAPDAEPPELPPAPPPGDDPDEPDGEGPWGGAWLPPDFPIVALGKLGRVNHMLDQLGQLASYPDKEIGRATIEGLMGTRPQLLEQYWPRLKLYKNADGEVIRKEVIGWRPEDAGRCIKAACAREGVWDPAEKVRGRGAWSNGQGDLILHFGDVIGLWPVDGTGPHWLEPGKIDELIYPAGKVLRRPALERESRLGVGAELLKTLQSWNWLRPELDPYLALGHLVAGVLGGALRWRPLAWLSGGKGTGKSTLQQLRKGLLGDWIVGSSDATAAGIWQKLKFDTRPVDIDELETGEETASRIEAIKALFRQAASGGIVLRGGADHEGHEFVARSVFLLSSIQQPQLNSADRSRLALLELRPLIGTLPEPDLGESRLEAMGRKLLRRVVDQWPRFAPTLALYAQAMREGGHDARGAAVFGTLLACHDLLLYDREPDSDTLAEWSRELAAAELAELAGDLPIEQDCLIRLLTQQLPTGKGGELQMVGELVARAVKRDVLGEPTIDAVDSSRILRQAGLEVRGAPRDKATGTAKWPGMYLWVAYRHAGTARLYEGSRWRAGGEGVGPWIQPLSRLAGAAPNQSFHCGAQTKAVLLPIEHCLPEDDTSAAARALARARSAADPASSSGASGPGPGFV